MSRTTPFRVVEERASGDTTIFTITIPEDSPYFDGHFPGRPVLPAVGQLAILTDLLNRVSGSPLSLAGVDAYRLSRQVLPGDRLEVRLGTAGVGTVGAGDTAAFSILCDSDLVSRGTLRVTAESAG